MRLFTFASLAVASVVVGLVTLAPVSAAAAPAAAAPAAAGKRVARRAGAASAGEGPRVLPAPLPKVEALPPLPPVARDVTAITTLTSASVGEGTSGPSDAAGPAPSPVAGGATEALPALPAAGPAVGSGAVSAARDVPVAPPGGGAREVKPTGFVLQLGMGVLTPATTFISGLRPLGPGVALELRLGYYATPHVGIVTGFRGSFGHELIGCSVCSTNGYSTQVPIIVQLADKDRTHGVYGEVGIGLGTTYSGPAGNGATYSFSSPVELKLGVGYRFAGAHGARPATTADLNVGVDIGSIESAEVRSKSGGTVTDTSSEPTHVVVASSLLVHFSL